jgi:uncharacterized membrane protein
MTNPYHAPNEVSDQPPNEPTRRLSFRRVTILLLGVLAFAVVVAVLDWLIMTWIVANTVPNPVYP